MMSVYRGCEMPLSCVTVTVVAAGPTNTGKTSLITRFKSDTFNEVSALLDFNNDLLLFTFSYCFYWF